MQQPSAVAPTMRAFSAYLMPLEIQPSSSSLFKAAFLKRPLMEADLYSAWSADRTDTKTDPSAMSKADISPLV